MNDQRQSKRAALLAIAVTAGILGWILFALAILGDFAARRAGKFDKDRENGAFVAQLANKEEALKKATDQLAPFFVFAREQFPGAPPDEQLEKLRNYFATTRLPPMRRYLEPTAVARIKTLLKDAPALDVEITGPGNDPEALVLAGEFGKLFESAGMQVRKITEYAKPPNDLRGVSIYSKSELNEALGNIIGELFAAVSQEKIQWVPKEQAETPPSGKGEPDMKIMIGPK